ncbi:Wzz/FepE/Etk N-terminal domain-containing protein [Arthrobacter sp. B10-11]|uniref:Wzz/FepE/Etk N-terminal domain-containing protein n=1 Tax=Arthrobacter sp. B10-11 TaxID=3081160 RepID=UPI0029546F78|nr:Wzz/FepE/Etk N-terminal domain-containing protein [Arthrobacter sp. B10-11]MDV8149806.1 Wzz/FepE/Etk N-terminal domain-containing protein [Arthrobacter sp. B10-11]
MDPISVLKTLWRHKWVAMPLVVLTIAACVYVMFFAQRSYQATMTYALITPKVPTALEMQEDPKLAKINGDNPYLRSPDSTLLSQVLITKLGAQETLKSLQDQGLGTEYTVSQASSIGSGMLLVLTASGSSPEQAVDTAVALGTRLTTTLHDVQKINGADEIYLYAALPVDGPGQAEEMFSSRLRTLIIVGVGGVVLVFGAVSVARSLELASAGRRVKEKPARHAGVSEGDSRGPQVPGSGRPRESEDHHLSHPDHGLPGGSFRVPVPDREHRT